MVRKNKRICPRMKSPLQSESSTILTKNSLAGLDTPEPALALANHVPLHQTRLVSSLLDSLLSSVEMMNLLMARWMKTTAMTPRTVLCPFHLSKYHRNSKKAINPRKFELARNQPHH